MHFIVIGDTPVSYLWSSILKISQHLISHLHSNEVFIKTVESQKGIVLKSEDDKSQICDVPFFLTFEEGLKILTENEKKAPHVDGVILFTTVSDTDKRLTEMQPKLQKLLDLNLIFICLQYGLGNVETLSKYVPRSNILLGSTVTHATNIREGTIRGISNRPTNLWSASGLISEHMRAIIKAFNGAGFPTTVGPEAEIMLWKKLAVNCSINVLSAICSLKIGSTWSDANNSGRDTVVQVAREIAQVAQLEGIKLTEQEAVDAVAFVAQKASNHVSDMCNDMLNQKDTSIEHFNGFVIRCAQKHNHVVYTTQNLYNIVKLMESTYEKRLKPFIVMNDSEEKS